MRARNKALLVALALGFATSTVAVTAAEAQHRDHRGERYRVKICKKTKGKNGTVIGGLTGGTLGAAVAGDGSRTEGAVLGGLVGAVAGNQIAKKKTCHYEYRYRR